MELFANNASSTLNGSITAGATSLVVASAANFPAGGNFRLLIDSEIMLVTAVSTNTLTVTRGQEGTTAVNHSNGAVVTDILTAGALVQAINDNKLDQRAAIVYSPVEIIVNTASVAPTSRAGSFTVGSEFLVINPLIVQGVFCYWAGGGTSLKGSLWDGATRLGTGTIAVAGAGYVYIPFNSAVTLAASELGKSLDATIWDTSGSNYTAATQSNIPNYPTPGTSVTRNWGGRSLIWRSWNAFAAGDATPSALGGTEAYPVEPVFTNPTTTTTANFTQPAFGSSVTLSVVSTAFMVAGQSLYVTTGGYYKIASIGGGTSVTIINVSDSTNGATAGTTILSGAVVI